MDALDIVALAILIYVNREQHFEIKKIEKEINDLEMEVKLMKQNKENETN